MKKGKIFLVPFGKLKTTDFLFTQAIKHIPGHDYSQIVYIGPTPRKIRDAQVSFTKAVSNQCFIPPHFYTIKQYTTELFQTYNTDKKKLSDFIKPLILKKLDPALSLGYAHSISEFIRDIKQYLFDLSERKLKNQILMHLRDHNCSKDDELYQRIQKILTIYTQYNKILTKHNYYDDEDIIKSAIEYIKEKVAIKILILDGFFYDLTKLEEKIVEALINKAETIYALSFYDERTPQSYALPQEFLTFIRKLNQLDEEIIREPTEIRYQLPYYVCASIDEEVEFIARQIKTAAIEKQTSLANTLVCFSNLQEYEKTVRRIFKKYQIPCSMYSTQALAKTKPVIAILELLRAIINNYPRLSTVAVLVSDHFQRFSAQVKNNIDYLSKKANIMKSLSSWQTLNKTLKTILTEERRFTPTLQKTIDQIQKEIRTFLVLSEKFRQSKETLKGYTKGLRQLLAQLQWCQNTNELSREILIIKDEFYQILSQIENFENDFGEFKISLEEYLKVLEYFLERSEIIPELTTHGVNVLGFAETRGLDCDYLYFGGLSEDKFPGKTRFDPILPEWLKQKLNLPSFQQHLLRTRFHYFRLVNTPRLKTILSFYNTDQDRVYLPSPYLNGEAIIPPKENTIFSLEQLQQETGRQEKIDVNTLMPLIDFSQDEEIKEMLNQRFGYQSHFSVTTLEKYPSCPYKFYLDEIIEIETLTEPEYKIEPKMWGNIVHKIFEKLYKHEVVPIEKLSDQIKKISDIVLKENKLSQFWQDVGRRVIQNLIPSFITIEQNLRNQGFIPYSTENRLRARINKAIKISGKIDRLDKNQNNQVIILDYKTGTIIKPSQENVQIGISLQLPLYAYLVKKNYPTYQIINAGFYSTENDQIIWLINNDKIDIDTFINIACQSAQTIIQNIRQGLFHLEPVSSCQYECPYNSICPIKLNPPPTKNEAIKNNTFSDDE